MDVGRMIGWLVGLVLVLVGIYMLYFETAISQFISLGVVTAGVLVFLGLAIMGFASNARRDRDVPEGGTHHETVIREERPPADTDDRHADDRHADDREPDHRRATHDRPVGAHAERRSQEYERGRHPAPSRRGTSRTHRRATRH